MSPVASVHGLVSRTGPDWAIVEVGGLGLRVSVPVGLAASLAEGQEVALHTHLQVREDGMSLFGFETSTDLDVFESLITVSGIGPKAALALLSSMTARELATAVVQGDVVRLRAVPGIGDKTAGRLVLELQGKLTALALGPDGAPAEPAKAPADNDVVAALVSLGYSQTEAAAAAAEVDGGDRPLEERIRLALGIFARKK